MMAAMLASPAALDEGAPAQIPRWIRPLLRPVTRRATMAFVRKYAIDVGQDQTEALRAALQAFRRDLRASGPFLLGSFSYADIVLATMMQGIAPVADRYIRL